MNDKQQKQAKDLLASNLEFMDHWSKLILDQLEPMLKKQGRTLSDEIKNHAPTYYEQTSGNSYWRGFEKYYSLEQAITFHYLLGKSQEMNLY